MAGWASKSAVNAVDVQATDKVPLFDSSQAAGSRDATLTIEQARLLFGGGATIVPDAGASYEMDVSKGVTAFRLTLSANCTLTITTPPAGAHRVLVEVVQPTSATATVTWPAGVTWAGGTPPTLTAVADAVDVIELVTVDAGTTWRGHVIGLDFS